MIRIVIICSLISVIKSNDCNFNADEVDALKTSFSDADEYIERLVRNANRNAAIVVGPARSGKSPEIGEGTVSKTSIPSKWNSAIFSNLDIWDSAGFDDSRGVKKDVNNSFYLHHLVKKVKTLKFVLVVSFEIITGNTEPFLALLRNLEIFLNGKFRIFFPSISLIISKAPFEISNYKIDNEYIKRKLERNIISQSNMTMSADVRDFVRHVKDNDNRIAFFRKARNNGLITSDIDDNIIGAIQNSYRIKMECLQDVGFSIAERTVTCLQKAYDTLNPMEEFMNMNDIINAFWREKFEFLHSKHIRNNANMLNSTRNTYFTKENYINNTSWKNSSIFVKIEIIENSDDLFKQFIKNQDLKNKINRSIFIDTLLKKKQMNFLDMMAETFVYNISGKISQLIALCSSLLNQLTIKQYRKQIKIMQASYAEITQMLDRKIETLVLTEKEKSNWEIIKSDRINNSPKKRSIKKLV
ncbi:uncharacterized protein LOC122510518 isoform X2 [Leptopilina heterotoma]|uniref:uncharacterized protein LOC122510518 isoform X2 n=1 Tax=Leptopilina heterotoma TaxID=63436 RepID=UPI001CA7EEAF|nr:uncharacterized protein LOC122510518 isoform X2 [Leptopilina heterotoma]